MFSLLKPVLLLSTVLFVSTSVSAQDQHRPDRQRSETSRGHANEGGQAYYDSRHRDWHQWNDQEKESYHRYAEQHHWKDRDSSSSSEREQQQYWNWRHSHPDSH